MLVKSPCTAYRINFDPIQRPGLRERIQEFREKNGNLNEAEAIRILVRRALAARGFKIS